MFDFENISKANAEMKFTEIYKKNYAEVPQRVQGFRKLCPCGFIETNIISNEGGIVVMRAEAGYYSADGRRVILGTGFAYEDIKNGNINRTSYIENCETSAVGRALGFIGLGSETSISSADEVNHAIELQNAMDAGEIPDPRNTPRPSVQESNTLPPEAQNPPKQPESPVEKYLIREMGQLRLAREIPAAENNALFRKQLKVLIANKLAPDKDLKDYTMDEAQTLIAFMYSKFTPKGTELKPIEDVGA